MFKSLKILIPLLLLIIGISFFYILSNYNSRSLKLELSAPDEAMIGVPFDLKVEFSNQSGAILNNALLIITLPDGLSFTGSSEDKLIENKDLGNIGIGSLISENFNVVLLKDENTSKKIKAVLNYSPAALTARFEKTAEKEIFVRGSGVSVEVTGPQKVFSGEEFDLDVIYKNISERDFTDLELKIDYPPSFSFKNSTLKPDKNNNDWIY